MSASGSLAAARVIIDRADHYAHGNWPRAAALLIRTAVEDAVAEVWRATYPAWPPGSGWRNRFICLPAVVDDRQVCREARQLWSELSAGCHVHPYELAPTIAELNDWWGRAVRLDAGLAPVVKASAG